VIPLREACRLGGGGRVIAGGGILFAGQFQEVGPDRVHVVAALQRGLRRLQDGQALGRAVDHRGGDRAVKGDDGVACHLLEEDVQGKDLRPVGGLGCRGLVMEGGDGRLELIFAHRAAGDGLGQEIAALCDALPVPQRAVLLREGDGTAVGRRPGRAAGIRKEHEGQQAARFGVARDGTVEQAGQADRLVGEVDAVESGARRGGVALVEQEVEDMAD
jgi:hypothetical protein